MNLLQTIKHLFANPDPVDEKLKEILQKKENLMLDKLASLFAEHPIQNVSQILSSVGNFVQFIEQRVGSDPAKLNEVIDHVKMLFDQHKK